MVYPVLLRCSLVLRVMCGVLGMLVMQTGRTKPSPQGRVVDGTGGRGGGGVVVANYSSTLDHVALELVMPHVMVRELCRACNLCSVFVTCFCALTQSILA